MARSSRKFVLPGVGKELQLSTAYRRTDAMKLLRALQEDPAVQEEAERRPDQLLKSVGLSIKGGVGKVSAGDLVGGPLHPQRGTGVALKTTITVIVILTIVIVIVVDDDD